LASVIATKSCGEYLVVFPLLQAAQRHFKEIKIMPEQFPDVLKSKVGHSLSKQPCRYFCLLLLELLRLICDHSE
jgi:hypothetical protein